MRTIRNSKIAGFSVVELIVVIALIAVISAFGANMSGVLTGRRAYAASEKLLELIERTKTETLAWSRGVADNTDSEMDVYLEIVRRSVGIYAVLHVQEEEADTLLISDRVAMMVHEAEGRNEALRAEESYSVTEERIVRLGFDKRTGALLPTADGRYVKRIVLQEGDRRYELRLVPATGYIYAQAGETVEADTEEE